eukprot:403360110
MLLGSSQNNDVLKSKLSFFEATIERQKQRELKLRNQLNPEQQQPEQVDEYKDSGIYTTIIPHYASLFAETIQYKNHFLQPIFLVRQDLALAKSVPIHGIATKSTMMGRDDIYRLFNGRQFDEKDSIYFTKEDNPSVLQVQALLIRVLDKDPWWEGGEQQEWLQMLEQLDIYETQQSQ